MDCYVIIFCSQFCYSDYDLQCILEWLLKKPKIFLLVYFFYLSLRYSDGVTKHTEVFGKMGRTNKAKVSPTVCLFFVLFSELCNTRNGCLPPHPFSICSRLCLNYSVAVVHLIPVYMCKCAQMYFWRRCVSL